MEQLLNSWKCRILSLKGVVTVVNPLALAPLLYVASIVHIPQQVSKEVKYFAQSFLCEGKRENIVWCINATNRSRGPQPNFWMKVRSLRLTWVKHSTDNLPGKWKAAHLMFLEAGDLQCFFKCNRPPLEGSMNMPNCYADICKAW